jgi:ABC-type amino acid transport substrate-binding protein
MRTSPSRIVVAALVIVFAGAALAACARRPAPVPAPAPTAARVAPTAAPAAPPPTAAPAPKATSPQPTTVIVEKAAPAAKIPTVEITTPTPISGPIPTAGTQDDWDRLNAAGRLVVGVSVLHRPFAYYNGGSELDGFDVAVAREIGTRLGLTTVFSDVVSADVVDALRSRTIDLALPNPGVTAAQDAAELTKPFQISRDVILAAGPGEVEDVRAPADLAGRVVGVLSGSRHEAWLQATLPEPGQPGAATVFTFTLVSQLVLALQGQQIDLAILDAVEAPPILKQTGLRIVGQDLDKQNRSLIVPKGANRLRNELDRVLAEMVRDGALARLTAQYLGLEPDDLVPLATPTSEQATTPTPSPTPTTGPPTRTFTVEATHIAPGECTRFSWNVESVREIYFYARGSQWESQPAVGQETRQVCPPITTTYDLRIVDADGNTEVRSITILVDALAQLPLSTRLSTNPPSTIALGECITLAWEVRGDPDRVQIVRDQSVLWANAPQAGSLQDCPPAAGTLVYAVLAAAPGHTVQTQRVIIVNP